MMREMVEVILYEDGEYEVNKTNPYYRTHSMVGMNDKGRYEKYICEKDKWKHYLLQMAVSTKDIDEKIKKLKEQKKARAEVAAKIKKELGL